MTAPRGLVQLSVNGVTHDRTDMRNAERFVELHGADVRYVHAWQRYLLWGGQRWQHDDTEAALRLAKETARTMLGEATVTLAAQQQSLADALSSSDGGSLERRTLKETQRQFEWSAKSQNAPRLHALLDVARADESIALRHWALDADPWVLNVMNGTIDLKTGSLRPHTRSDLITKLAPTAFDAEATCPVWDAFLDRAMGGDPALVTFLQRMVGYALTGETREHVIAFLYGGGANGKSTFLTTVHMLLGEYATPAARGLLFRARGERHPTELAALFGARFVTCSEIDEGQAFDEALLKDLTGGDHITCRRMREDFWNFVPTHKLFIAGNYKPTVRGDDDGIWRRLRLIPWTVTIPEAERDKRLGEKLRAELPGILAWAVRGCLEWQRDGLGNPAPVRQATAEYREESDAFGEFVRLYVAFDADASIVRKVLREAYETFAKENGGTAIGAKRFATKLRAHGVGNTSVRIGAKVLDGWKGVRLKTDAERAAATAWNGSRRDEGTCREHEAVDAETVGLPWTADPDSNPTSHYRPTGSEGVPEGAAPGELFPARSAAPVLGAPPGRA